MGFSMDVEKKKISLLLDHHNERLKILLAVMRDVGLSTAPIAAGDWI